jgi:hypothetical protein
MEAELSYEVYNDKSFVVRGNRDKYAVLMKKCSGRWNSRLKQGAGWIVPKENEKDIKNIIQSISVKNNNVTEIEDKVTSDDSCDDQQSKNVSINSEEDIQEPQKLNIHRSISASKFKVSETSSTDDESEVKNTPVEEKIIQIIKSEQVKKFESEKKEFERKNSKEIVKDNNEEKQRKKERKEEKQRKKERKERKEERQRKKERKEETHREKHKDRDKERKEEREREKHKERKKQRKEEKEKQRDIEPNNTDNERKKERKEERHKDNQPNNTDRKHRHKEHHSIDKERKEEVQKTPETDNNKLNYYKAFSKKPREFTELYPSSENEIIFTCSDSESVSSDNSLIPHTPKRKNLKGEENYDELFSKVKQLQKKISQLELKNKREKY